MIDGWLQTAGRSQRAPATLQVEPDGHTTVDGVAQGMWSGLRVSSRIGNTRRFIALPHGASFETDDNDGIDTLLRQHGVSRSVLHRLESSLRFAITGVVLVAVAGWFFFTTGLPALSQRVAAAMPAKVVGQLGGDLLDALDDKVLEPSALPAERQAQLQALFASLKPRDSAFDLRLNLRSGDHLGTNAFALPDGNIVLSDALVELINHDAQIAAILQHEIGHVEHRHGLQKVLQASATTAVLYSVTGDASGLTGLIAAAPALMLQFSYSRDMETDADLYAVRQLRAAGEDPEAMISALNALHASFGDHDVDAFNYLSTHPLGEARITPLRAEIDNPG